MTETEVVINDTDKFSDDDHYVCCKVDAGSLSFTTTVCGKQIFTVVVEADDDDDDVTCEACEIMNDYPGCPLGHICPQDLEEPV